MSDSSCLFCKIARGEIPSARIYEDDAVLAFLDMGPVRPGHALIIPKAHYENVLETPASLAPKLLQAFKIVGRALMNATGAQGFNIMQNNFSAAGQMVFHTHWHIIPREEGDGISHWTQGKYESPEAMRALADKIAANLDIN